jgi:peptidoglycan hydrolase CwlO-like protein
MASSDNQKALEADLEAAVKTLVESTNDLKSISEAKAELVIGQKKVTDLVAALVDTAKAQSELKKTLSTIATNSKRTETEVANLAKVSADTSKALDKRLGAMQDALVEHEASLWMRTVIGLGAIVLLLLILLFK